ncbi:MAG: hypothetical protein R3C52_10285 [Hyphomonadaceae bacterium]
MNPDFNLDLLLSTSAALTCLALILEALLGYPGTLQKRSDTPTSGSAPWRIGFTSGSPIRDGRCTVGVSRAPQALFWS